MPKLIEIIGAPGSGKTFISENLQKIKKDKNNVFFHSSQKQSINKKNKLNFLSRALISIKVIKIMIFFYLFFFRRIFLKKIYKRKFFLRVVLLMYRDLIAIETLKKTLSSQEFLIMEPGLIMYFLQDYFYVNENISEKELNIFNRFFLNVNFIVYLDPEIELIKKRLNKRKRGFPERMKSLTIQDKNRVLNKSKRIIKDYIFRSQNLNVNLININSSKNIKNISKTILKSIHQAI